MWRAGLAPNTGLSNVTRAARAATRQTLQVSRDAIEDCHDAVAAWKEHSLRPKSLFQSVPEPDASKCNLRAISRRLDAASSFEGDGSAP